MSRPDLAALTPDAIAVLTNVGLVKRAQREIAAGQGPQLSEAPDGTVTGTFPDGAVAKLPRSTPLDVASCTCGAPRACRHRVAVVLAYADWHQAQVNTPSTAVDAPHDTRVAPAVSIDSSQTIASSAAWSPAEVDDATLEVALGKRLLDTARATRDRGLLVTLELASVPAAKLPSCTVRFLVPRDVAYAKCDCVAAGGRCEHLALAVWAFRALKTGTTGGIVQLGAASAGSDAKDAALDDALALLHTLLEHGVAGTPALAARFATARSILDRAGLTWLTGLVADLEIALEGYARRSARFGAREIAALLTELGARVRAGRRDGPELPARFVLGADQARETLLDHLRLTSLGARIGHDDTARFADVFLADTDTATVLVLSKRWDYAPGETPEDGPALARRSLAPRITLTGLAHGALVSKAVTRRASRAISLGVGGSARSSLTPQAGDFAHLPAPLLVRNLAQHAQTLAHRPPRLLRPRVLAEEVHVIAVSQVLQVAYDEAEQTLIAALTDAAGHPFVVTLTHRRSAPHAIEAAAQALAGPVRFVAGDLRHGPRGWTLEPVSITSERFVVPDLSGPVAVRALPRGARQAPTDPVEAALTRAESVLQELCHSGVARPPAAALQRALAASIALEDVGLARLARRLRTTASAASPSNWMDAAIRLALTREAEGLAL